MSPDPDFAAAASLLVEPARAAMLARLLDGRAWTATELAKAAGVAASTGSAHLARLQAGGWVTVHPEGRHRYYRLASADLASFLETFARMAPTPEARTPGEQRASVALRHCRLCYDHLAGRIGVALTETAFTRGWLSEPGVTCQLTSEGRRVFATLELELPYQGRGCMDWSERKLHLAGPLGRELTHGFITKGWLQRDPKSRALWVTPSGKGQLEALFQIDLPDQH